MRAVMAIPQPAARAVNVRLQQRSHFFSWLQFAPRNAQDTTGRLLPRLGAGDPPAGAGASKIMRLALITLTRRLAHGLDTIKPSLGGDASKIPAHP